MFSEDSRNAMPRSAEIAEACLTRMHNGSETDKGYAVLGMQCGYLQASLSAHPECREWLSTPAGKQWRLMFADFIDNLILAGANSPEELRASKRDFVAGLAAFTQDVTGKRL